MIVAVTGVILILFVIGHLLGNLQIFLGPEWINSYAEHLRELGPLLWIIRGFLLIDRARCTSITRSGSRSRIARARPAALPAQGHREGDLRLAPRW